MAEAAVAAAKPDVVVHAAARIGVVRCEDEPELALRSNVIATAFVARAAVAHGTRLAFVSTSDVYGAAGYADEDTPPAPESLYAHTKLWAEQAAALYVPDGLVLLRLANPYGPGVDSAQGKGALTTMLLQARPASRSRSSAGRPAASAGSTTSSAGSASSWSRARAAPSTSAPTASRSRSETRHASPAS